MNKVYRLTVANITREDLTAAARDICLQGATIWQGTGYSLDYAQGATEYNFTLETVCSLTVARALWVSIQQRCSEDSIYVVCDGHHAAIWYREPTVFVLTSTEGN